MTEWTVLLVIGEIITLFLVVGKPIMSLSNTITLLKASVDSLRLSLTTQEADNKAEHKQFSDHFKGVDEELQDHEFRIKSLENK